MCFGRQPNLLLKKGPSKHTYHYNEASWLDRVLVQNSGGPLAKFDYTFADSTAGRTGARTGEKLNDAARAVYTYDPLYRLTLETLTANGGGPSGTISYDTAAGYTDSSGFDHVGNRRSRTTSLTPAVTGFPNGTVNSSYNSNDRLTSDTYDANGNTTVAGGFNYTYDFDNRLRTRNGSPSLAFGYDHDGNRVTKTNGTTVTTFLIDEHTPAGYPQVVEEATSGTITNYVYGLRLISQRTGTAVQYYGHDGHGNVRLLLTSGGSVSQAFTYDGFGNLVSGSAATSGSPYLYCGERLDIDLGMYYLRARYYNQDKGRFWTMDTYGGDLNNPISLHAYLYASANSVNEEDTTGEVATFSPRFGGQAEAAIRTVYTNDHPRDTVLLGRWTRLGSPTNTAYRLKPDMLNTTTLKWAEVKPLTLSGVLDGMEAYRRYNSAFSPFGYSPDAGWKPSTHRAIVGSVEIVLFNFGGIIFYTDDDISDLVYKGLVVMTLTGAKDLVNVRSTIMTRTVTMSIARSAGKTAGVAVVENDEMAIGQGIASENAALGGE